MSPNMVRIGYKKRPEAANQSKHRVNLNGTWKCSESMKQPLRSESAGLCRIRIDSDAVVSRIKLPSSFLSDYGNSWCKYKDDSIVLVQSRGRWNQGALIIFNTKNRKISHKKKLPRMGTNVYEWEHNPSCVAIGDYIHIFHGDYTRQGQGYYFVYSVNNNTNRTLKCFHLQPHRTLLPTTMRCPAIKTNDQYQSSNKMLISGFSRMQSGKPIPVAIIGLLSTFCIFELFSFTKGLTDSFYIGKLENGDPIKPIQWTLAPEYRLKYPMSGFGYIQHGPFIVTFGGRIRKRKRGETREHCTDDIYILDLRKKSGWIQSAIKCPEKLSCNAVMDEAQRVHLFTKEQPHSHYYVDLNDIIPLSTY